MLRAALIREAAERRRAECLAKMQTDVVQLALDLLVREPDIEGFFGALTKTMVEEGESHACAVWLIDEERQRCDAVDDLRRRSPLHAQTSGDWDALRLPAREHGDSISSRTRRVDADDPVRPATIRGCPEPVRAFTRRHGVQAS